MTYTHILDLAKESEPPADGILSRTVYQDDRIKAVIFGFGQGQELSEHTASKPAMLFFAQGEATLGLGDDVQESQVGTWVHRAANLKHSIKAKTPVVMLLVLLKKQTPNLPCLRLGHNLPVFTTQGLVEERPQPLGNFVRAEALTSALNQHQR